MIKSLLIALMGVALIGCTPQVKTVYQQVNIPVYVTPAPPVYQKPDLYITHLTPYQQDNIGELAKAYRITLKQEQQYICVLESIITKYGDLSKLPPAPNAPSVTLSDKDQQDCNNP